eukprot:SAG22_NODE_179_length_16124_cov_7.355445_3_plen_157_part_00
MGDIVSEHTDKRYYRGLGGWNANAFNGVERAYFLFADSFDVAVDGAYIAAGHFEGQIGGALPVGSSVCLPLALALALLPRVFSLARARALTLSCALSLARSLCVSLSLALALALCVAHPPMCLRLRTGTDKSAAELREIVVTKGKWFAGFVCIRTD